MDKMEKHLKYVSCEKKQR